MLRLNYDHRNTNGIIFNETYPTGAIYIGVNLKPNMGFEYDSFIYQEGNPESTFKLLNNQKVLLTVAETAMCKTIAVGWTQELGQEGNPTPEQLTATEDNKNRQYLLTTDWYVIRFTETGVVTPQEITDARTAARAAIQAV